MPETIAVINEVISAMGQAVGMSEDDIKRHVDAFAEVTCIPLPILKDPATCAISEYLAFENNSKLMVDGKICTVKEE